MPSNPPNFRLTDATRLIKAAIAAGLRVRRVTQDERGRPVLITGQDGVADEQKNPLDRILNASDKNGTS
jgi:hypothetical protein